MKLIFLILKSYRFSNNIKYAACEDLPVLESSLHWNYHPSSGVVDVAFNKANAKDSSWVAWAINPISKGMVGSQSFVAVHKSNGTIKAYTSPITSYATMLQEGNLSFSVYSLSTSYTNGGIIIYATFQLPPNKTVVNHAWQEGLVSEDGTLKAHSFSRSNLQSYGTIDFISGKVSKSDGDVNSRTMLRNVRNLEFMIFFRRSIYFDLVNYVGSWNFEYRKLGNNDADWSDDGSLLEGGGWFGKHLVSLASSMPITSLLDRHCWLWNWFVYWKPLWDSSCSSSMRWNHSNVSCICTSSCCCVFEA